MGAGVQILAPAGEFVSQMPGTGLGQVTLDTVLPSPQPILIARPSVVAGREHTIRIDYNSAGQPLRISENGYAPALPAGEAKASDKTPDQGQGSATPISRTTTYRYQKINGRSVLAQIDGPLPNGPQGSPTDSDITTFTYDARADHPLTRTAPGNFTTSYTYDDAGRITSRSLNDGSRRIDTDAVYEGLPTVATQAQQLTRSAWLLRADGQIDAASRQSVQVLQARYDALGRRTRSSGADGLQKTLRYVGTHPGTLTNADGRQTSWAYDNEGRLLAQVSQEADGSVTAGRLWLHDERGRLLATLNPQGLERIFAYLDEPGAAPEQAAIDDTTARPANVARSILRDDFGRIVHEHHPEDGRIDTFFEQGTGSEVQTQRRTSTDGKMQSSETLVFDIAGRLQSRSRGRAGQDRCTETLRYQGRLLIELAGCGSSQHFERDAFGKITAHTRIQTQDQTRNQQTTQSTERY
ncbi:MAG: hypothetical protein ACTS5I_01665, partial [Rhodanobacter sp.]